jgi:hypothetical protein
VYPRLYPRTNSRTSGLPHIGTPCDNRPARSRAERKLHRIAYIHAGSEFTAKNLVRVLGSSDLAVAQTEDPLVCSVETPRFDAMPLEQVGVQLRQFISYATALLQTFQPGVHVSLQEAGYTEVRPDGRKRYATNWFSVSVVDGSGIEALAKRDEHSATFACRVISQAEWDEDLCRALALLPGPETTWAQLYDVIKFLGDAAEIQRREWSTKVEVDRHRQTANHYRHQGDPQRNPLPQKPPSIAEVREYVLGLMRRWITERVQGPP